MMLLRNLHTTEPQSYRYHRWQAVLLCFFLLVLTSVTRAAEPVTRVYLVRHSEKVDSSRDPLLSQAGQQRARELAHVLQDADIQAIYVTDYQRSKLTAQPLADALGLEPQIYPASDVQAVHDLVMKQNLGGSVLVVGHSNTLAKLAAVWGISDLADLEDNQYDRLWVVHVQSSGSQFQRLRFGEATP